MPFNGTGGTCPTANVIDEPNSNNHTADYNRTYTTAAENFDFGGNFSADVVPVFNTGCNGGDGSNAISLGFVAYTYTITVTIEIDNVNAPDATPDHSDVCPGDGAIDLLGSTTATGTTTTYNWTGPNGFTASSPNTSVPTLDPADEGTYTLIVDVDGCLSAPVDVTVEYLTFAPQVNAVDNTVCFGENIDLAVTGGGTSFAWMDPAGNPVGGNTSSLTTPAGGTPGTQTYSVTVSDANCSETLTINIDVFDQITGDIILNPTGGVCAGEPTMFTAQRADGSPFPAGWTFDWNSGDGTGPTYSFTQNTPGNYTMNVTVSSPDGCSRVLSQAYDVTAAGGAPGQIISDPVGGGCADEAIEFTAVRADGSAYPNDWTFDWNNGDGSGRSYMITENTPGSYTVDLTVSSPAGCGVMMTENFVVSASAGPPGQIVLDPTGGTCAGETIEFTAVRADGSAYPNDWTFDWDNGEGAGRTYTINEDTPGSYTVNLTVFNPSGCSVVMAEPFEVYDLPVVSIAPAISTICDDGSVDIVATATDGTGAYEYLWWPGQVETTETITIDNSSPATANLFVVVTDDNGCVAASNFAEVTILSPSTSVTFNGCVSGSATEITFSWDDVGQDAFEVYLTEGTGAEQTISTTYTNLSFTATGLTPGVDVTIRVVPVSSSNGTRCTGMAESQTCSTTASCNNPGWIHTPVQPVCLTSDGQAFNLAINTTETGTVVLNSTDLGLTNQPNGPGGMTSVSLPALPGATSSGVYTVMARFTLPDGTCPFDTTFNIPVVTPADPEISTPISSICSAQANVRFTLINDYDPNANYTISVDGASGSFITLEDAPNRIFEISFSEYRTYQITVTATTSGNNSCSESFTLPFTLVQPPTAPTLTCAGTGLDSVAFSWSDVGGSYTVDQITVPAAGVAEQTATGFIVRGLAAGDAVTIAVTATTTGGCAPVISDTITCIAQSCPAIVPQITTPVDTFCSDGSEMLVNLTVNVPASGTVEWSGPGVMVNSNQFDPAAAGVGEHEIMVVYTEGACSYPATFQLVVVDPPSGMIDIVATDLCQDETTTINLNGTNLVNADFEWILPTDATLVSGSLTGPGPLEVSFSSPGGQFAELVITGPFCAMDTLRDSVFVDTPITRPVLACAGTGLDSVAFSWTDVGDSYLVDQIAIPAAGVVEQTATGFIVRGLMAGDAVTIAVTAIATGVCAPVISDTVTCIAQSCPAIVPQITTPVDTFCSDGSEMLVELTVDVPAAGSVEWSGPGVMIGSSQFDPAAAGVGEHEIMVVYTEGACTYPATFQLVVVDPPSGIIDIVATDLCQGETTTINLNGTNLANADFEWILPNDAALISGSLSGPGPLEVSFSGLGGQFAELVITGPFCEMDTLRDSIFVDTPIAPLSLACAGTGLDSVAFAWADVGDNYLVDQIAIPGTGVVEQTATGFIVRGLNAGDAVTIAVTAMANRACFPVTSDTITCIAQSCPAISFEIDQVGPFCVGEDVNIQLATTVMGGDQSGVLTFRDSTFSVGGNFNSTALTPGLYTVTAVFDEGGCSFPAAVGIEIIELPDPTFTLPTGPICVDEVVGADAGAEVVGRSYVWSAPDPAATVLATSATTQDISWSTPGLKEVTLVARDNNGCEDTFTRMIEVVAPLSAPVASCGNSSATSVEFNWTTEAGVDSFQVTVNGEAAFFQDSTNFFVGGLNEGELVDIEVVAFGSGACGNSLPGTASCEAETCPVIAVTPPANQAFCLGAAGNDIVLNATQNGGTASGTFFFDGPGVTENSGIYTFSADAAGIGEHLITVNYDEGTCSGMATVEFTVNEAPASDFTLNGLANNLTLCEGESFSLAYSGNLPEASSGVFEWNTTPVNRGVAIGYETYEFSYPVAGDYVISLSVSDNGCESEITQLNVTVVAQLPAPVVSCEEVAENSVIFGWESIPGAVGYQLDDGTILASNELNYTVIGLSPEESTTLSVVALSAAACGNSLPSTVQSCTTLPDLSCNFSISLGDGLSISIGDSLRLSLVSNALIDSISWQNTPGLSCLNCPEPFAKPLETTTYSVTAIDENGCIASDDLTIIVDETRKIYIPNVFSPNGDGINDYFEIQGGPDLTIIRDLNIYDRWGALLFNANDQPTNSPSARWGGERLGQPVETGVYIYSAIVQFADGHIEQVAGEVMIMR